MVLNKKIEKSTFGSSSLIFYEISKKICVKKYNEKVSYLAQSIELLDIKDEKKALLTTEYSRTKKELLALINIDSINYSPLCSFDYEVNEDKEMIAVRESLKNKISDLRPNESSINLYSPGNQQIKLLEALVENKSHLATVEGQINYFEELVDTSEKFNELSEAHYLQWLDFNLKYSYSEPLQELHIDRSILFQHTILHQGLDQFIRDIHLTEGLFQPVIGVQEREPELNVSFDEILSYIDYSFERIELLYNDDVIYSKIILFMYYNHILRMINNDSETYDLPESNLMGTRKIMVLHELGILERWMEFQNYEDKRPLARDIARMLGISHSSAQSTINGIYSSSSKNNPYKSKGKLNQQFTSELRGLLKI